MNRLIYCQEIKKLENMDNLISKLKEYVIGIPENVTFSILPVLRWESSKGSSNSRSISDSIKVIRNINLNLLAEKLMSDIKDNILEYNLRDENSELFIMGRPWLSVDEFNIDKYLDRKNLELMFNSEIEKKILAWKKSFNVQNPSDKTYRIKKLFI